MSEFECSKGHLVKPSERICPICGGKIVRMDGMTGSQLKRKEASESRRESAVDREPDECEEEQEEE